jgi:hypothetical protein
MRLEKDSRKCVTSICSYKARLRRCARICPWNRPDTEPADFRGWDGDIKKISAMWMPGGLSQEANFRTRGDTKKWWFDLRGGRPSVHSQTTRYEILE